ncbi:ABC transporter permease [Lactobacillus sp. LL6]|uniref:ABC transporter permease n=1 Tax=Lactobacillus sp. LL6 TaxID=2596827 RepID=UPI0011856B38|nr:ABC transporter permease [Lactobacillus sp. LL6]TSO25535.1 ABC transporter permease [Lactobacillus sp. LL6]
MSSTYRVTLRSVANFDSFQTILVDYFLMPIISLVMFLLIAFNSTQDYSRILLGTIITTAIATGIGVISASSVYDQNIAMTDEVFSIRPSFRRYWLPKFIIAGVTASCEILVLGIIGLFALKEIHLLGKLILSLPLVVITLALLGYFGSILGIKKENPYWLTNFISASLVLLSGVIIPVAQYPTWLKIFATLFPISNILDWILDKDILNYDLLIIIGKLLLWWIVCIFATKIIQRNYSRN